MQALHSARQSSGTWLYLHLSRERLYSRPLKKEHATAGATIMTVVDPANLYVRIDLEETAVAAVPLHAAARITAEGLPGKEFAGRVIEIGRYAEFATQRDVTRGRQDIKTFRVKVKPDDPGGLLKPGMTVFAEIKKKT